MNLKSDVDELDIDKLKNVPSNKNHVVAKMNFKNCRHFTQVSLSIKVT